MPAILTPALALRHLRELSTDVRAAIALAPGGDVLGGDAAIAAPARALLQSAGTAPWTQVVTADGAVLVERAPAAAFVVVAGPHALLELLSHDLQTLVRDTEEEHQRERAGEAGPRTDAGADPLSRAPLEAAARALIGACAADLRR